MRKPTFKFNGREYAYFSHEYNNAAHNSRSVEIPLALHFMSEFDARNCVEIGNVISHYSGDAWRAVDLREGPVKADFMRLNPKRKLDAILSISTLEHVGHGKYAGTGVTDPQEVIRHLVGWLRVGGKMLATIPVGYNKLWDEAILAGAVGTKRYFMLRQNDENEWKQCSLTAAFEAAPRQWRWGAALAILRIDRGKS